MRHVDVVWIFIWGKTHRLVKIRCSTLSTTSPWFTTSSIRLRSSTILITIVDPTGYQHIIQIQVLNKTNPSKYYTLLKDLQRSLLSITCFSVMIILWNCLQYFKKVLQKRASVSSSPKAITYECCFLSHFLHSLLNWMQCVDVGEGCHQHAAGSSMRSLC